MKGVESRVENNLSLGEAMLDSVGKAKEQGVAAGKHHYVIVILILLKHSIERHGDVDPLRPFGQESSHELMVTLAAREQPPLLDDFHHLGWEIRLRGIGYANHIEFHKSRPGFS